jgi:ApbE superfamily uncharacterized protein (UPF0280 family)
LVVKRERIRVEETIATVIIEDEFLPHAIRSVQEARTDIKDQIRSNPEFQSSYKPVTVSTKAPKIIQEMATAAALADVGPMASVAGAIAKHVVDELIYLGADHVIFDNGGDIAMFLERPAVIGIYAGPAGLSGLGFHMAALGDVQGLCTSSGTIGHSHSFGVADAAIVLADSPVVADAVATKLGNLVRSRDPDLLGASLRRAMIGEIQGCMVIVGHALGSLGHMPEVVRANVDYDVISKAVEVRL